MPSEKVNEATRREWRELGFYYDRDDDKKCWLICGSRKDLAAFARHIQNYAQTSSSRQLSEHIHLGPYMYLEIGTWGVPEITDHWIAGPVEALAQLAEAITSKVEEAAPNATINLRQVFSPGSPYELMLVLQPDQFDPARADPACW